MCVRTQPPIGHEHITGCYHRVHLLHLGEIVREEGRDDQLEEHTGAGMEQPQEVRHGKAAPQSLLGRLAERILEGGCIGHRASRAIDEKGAMAMPSAFTRDGGCTALLKRSRRRAKRRSGSLARAWQYAAALNRKPDRWGRWLQAVLPCSICNRNNCTVVTGVRTRSRHPV